MSQCKSWGGSSVFEWLCCVCSQTRLGPGPRQQGRQVQEEGFPTLGTERSAEGRCVAQRRSAQAKRGRLGCLLSRARDGVPQPAWFPCINVRRRGCFGRCSSGGRCGQEQGQRSMERRHSWTLADLPVLISPDGVSQFRVVKQLVTSEYAVPSRR